MPSHWWTARTSTIKETSHARLPADLARRPARRTDERGASAVEYGLLIAGIAALIVLVVYAFGGVVLNGLFQDTCTRSLERRSRRQLLTPQFVSAC